MPRRNFFQSTSSHLDEKNKIKIKKKIWLKYLIVDGNALDAPQKKQVAIENSLRLHTRGSPATAAEGV